MKYMLLLYQDEADPERTHGEQNIKEHIAVARRTVADGAYVAASPLRLTPTATTVRVRGDNATVTDGPFSETKEALGGYYLLDCRDLDQAIAYAAALPQAREACVEIRPVFEIAGWDEKIGLHAPDGTG
ncbi:MAG: YciI family protein [Dehalococcoidia bacterium]